MTTCIRRIHRLRWRRLAAATLVVGVLGGLAPALAAPAATFTWSRPDRYRDLNDDGFRDPSTTAAEVSAPFAVWADACQSDGDGQGITQYQWRSSGFEPVDTTECAVTLSFASEGAFDVSLTVVTDLGSASVTQQVDVNDLLIVALGDSYASGEGNPHAFGYPETGLPLPINVEWDDTVCHRSAYAGPAQAAAYLEEQDPHTSVTFVHLACSGAKIEDQLLPTDVRGPMNNFQPELGGLLDPYEGQEVADYANAPSHPAQVDAAASLTGSRDVDAMTVSIGGNDIHFAGIVKDCIINVIGCNVDSDIIPNPDGVDILNEYLPQLSGRYDRFATRLTEQFGDRLTAQNVFITEYPDSTRCDDGTVCAMIPHVITTAEGQWAGDTVLPGLNAVIANRADAHGWTFVDGISEGFQDGHGYAAANTWMVGLVQSLLQQGGKDGAFHPNVAGHTWYRNRILAKVGPQLAPGGFIPPSDDIVSEPFQLPAGMSTPDFTTDRDGDLLPDLFDNCPRVSNPDQKDDDHDYIGDACGFTIGQTDGGGESDLRDPQCQTQGSTPENESVPPPPSFINVGGGGPGAICAIGAAVDQTNESGTANTGTSSGDAGNFAAPGTYSGTGTLINGMTFDGSSTPLSNSEILTTFELPMPRCQALFRRPCVAVEGSFNVAGASGTFGLHGLDISGAVNVEGSAGIEMLGNWVGGHFDAATYPADRVKLRRVSGRVGGAAWWQRNVISGGEDGIEVAYNHQAPLVIEGNYIGTDVGGIEAVPNTGDGIAFITHGGETENANPLVKHNVIAGNAGDGISTGIPSVAPAIIVGNKIGVNAAGNALGNGGFGIYNNDTDDLQIGGTAAGDGNTIANNGKGGIQVQAGLRVSMLRNEIWNNGSPQYPGGLGINIAQHINDVDMVLPNDADDADGAETAGIAFPNQGQNFPVLTGVQLNGAGTATVVNVTLDAHANTTYRVELFSNTSGCEPSRHGEGRSFLRALNLTTQSNGIGGAAATVNTVLGPGTVVTATATDPNGNTSEFSHGMSRSGACSGMFTVDDAGDADDGQLADGTCDTGTAASPTGNCTLRAAIAQANAAAGFDTIRFDIGSGPVTITPATSLPAITGPTTIDGTTQPGFAGVPIVRLDGATAGSGGRGLEFNAAGGTARGLSITGFGDAGVIGLNARNLLVAGNYIGVQPDGTTAAANHTGILLQNSPNSTVGGIGSGDRNVVSGNIYGISLVGGGPAGPIFIQGNYVGTNATGTAAVPNSWSGVSSAFDETVIGGTTAAARNVISGNGFAGITLSGTHATVTGNRVGTNALGTAGLGNGSYGMLVTDDGHVVGGTTASEANLVAFNGVGIDAVSGNVLRRNSIHSNVGSGLNVNPSGGIPAVAAPQLQLVDGSTVRGRVTGPPGEYSVEIFANDGPCGSATEAQQFVKRAAVTIAAGDAGATFVATLPELPSSSGLTAIAVHDMANTSPISGCLLNTDITAPRGVAVRRLPKVQTRTRVPLSLVATEAGAPVTFQVQARKARWDDDAFGAFTTFTTTTDRTPTYEGSPGTSVCFRTRARDAAGNVSGWSPVRCTTIPLDDRALSGGDWIRASDSGSYQGTFSKSAREGATLTRTGATARRLAVVVTRCPGCGSLSVRWSGTLVGTVDLSSAIVRRKVVVVLPVLANPGRGTVKVVAHPGRNPARVDGVGIIRP